MRSQYSSEVILEGRSLYSAKRFLEFHSLETSLFRSYLASVQAGLLTLTFELA